MQRSETMLDKVRQFHEATGRPVDLPFNNNALDQIILRENLIEEEYNEVIDASVKVYDECITAAGSLVARRPTDETKSELLKELVDIVYVVLGYAATFGLPFETAFNRVHESNMSKLVDGKPLLRADGKVLKGPNYQPPYLMDLVS